MKKQYGFKFHPELVEKGKEQAKKEIRSYNNWVENLMEKALNEVSEISPELLKAVKKYAKKNKTDVTSVIVKALTKEIN